MLNEDFPLVIEVHKISSRRVCLLEQLGHVREDLDNGVHKGLFFRVPFDCLHDEGDRRVQLHHGFCKAARVQLRGGAGAAVYRERRIRRRRVSKG